MFKYLKVTTIFFVALTTINPEQKNVNVTALHLSTNKS